MAGFNASTLARLAARLKCARHGRLPALWLLSDTQRLNDPRAAIAALPPGAGFIFRHYETAQREAVGRALRQLCRRHRIVFLVAGDARLALRLGADGVHLPQRLAHHATAARRRRGNWLITVSAHNAPSLVRAANVGADAALLAPVFATASHPGAKPLGRLRFAMLAHSAKLAVIALGGIHPGNARQLTGAAGIAAISGLN